ncbi:hypothetical protein BS50DRAFT_309251 [Corynespora cassiicola Philippines]|uniref:Uncharacterized protein n=1 Tax=Corynespora cassiicola Philippines TaxID=1448308 RepID=A0A2T2NXV3_CORCC|nr:hypothetical protein BS50DRAFT_309251 [Corynespora cassiicola Philippines]
MSLHLPCGPGSTQHANTESRPKIPNCVSLSGGVFTPHGLSSLVFLGFLAWLISRKLLAPSALILTGKAGRCSNASKSSFHYLS